MLLGLVIAGGVRQMHVHVVDLSLQQQLQLLACLARLLAVSVILVLFVFSVSAVQPFCDTDDVSSGLCLAAATVMTCCWPGGMECPATATVTVVATCC
jgi:hypothetical protein